MPTTAAEPGSDADLAITAALAGAAVVRDHYGTALSRVDKGGGDFATAADLAAERAILATLRAARPHDALVGEETGRTGPTTTDRTWLVDPLCGTLNYAARTTLVAVNVALVTPATTLAAATADPFTHDLFWTDGTHAWSRPDPNGTDGWPRREAASAHARSGRGTNGTGPELQGDRADEPLTRSAATALVDLNLDPPFPNAPAFRAAAMLTDPEFGARFRPRVLSTTLALAWVAAGRRAAYVTDGHLTGSVHFTAGIALCQAAGCVVTDLAGDPPHTGAGGLIAAADPATHQALLALARMRRI